MSKNELNCIFLLRHQWVG